MTTIPFDQLPDAAFVRLPMVLSLIPVGKSTWWAKVQTGEYPKPYKVGPRTSVWKVGDIRALLSSVDNNWSEK